MLWDLNMSYLDWSNYPAVKKFFHMSFASYEKSQSFIAIFLLVNKLAEVTKTTATNTGNIMAIMANILQSVSSAEVFLEYSLTSKMELFPKIDDWL